MEKHVIVCYSGFKEKRTLEDVLEDLNFDDYFSKERSNYAIQKIKVTVTVEDLDI